MSINPSSSAPSLSHRQPASSAFAARFQIEHEHWKSVLAHIEEPATAQLIVNLFANHPHLQATHPAVYLRAQRCLHRAEKKSSTAKAAGKALKLVLVALHRVAMSAYKGAMWAISRIRFQSARTSVEANELRWPELSMPDA